MSSKLDLPVGAQVVRTAAKIPEKAIRVDTIEGGVDFDQFPWVLQGLDPVTAHLRIPGSNTGVMVNRTYWTTEYFTPVRK